MSNKGRVGHTFGKQQHEEKKHRVHECMFNIKQFRFRPRPQTEQKEEEEAERICCFQRIRISSNCTSLSARLLVWKRSRCSLQPHQPPQAVILYIDKVPESSSKVLKPEKSTKLRA